MAKILAGAFHGALIGTVPGTILGMIIASMWPEPEFGYGPLVRLHILFLALVHGLIVGVIIGALAATRAEQRKKSTQS
jgi:uncharacterized membrane-anchored protein YhcB (DUF1043 family)